MMKGIPDSSLIYQQDAEGVIYLPFTIRNGVFKYHPSNRNVQPIVIEHGPPQVSGWARRLAQVINARLRNDKRARISLPWGHVRALLNRRHWIWLLNSVPHQYMVTAERIGKRLVTANTPSAASGKVYVIQDGIGLPAVDGIKRVVEFWSDPDKDVDAEVTLRDLIRAGDIPRVTYEVGTNESHLYTIEIFGAAAGRYVPVSGPYIPGAVSGSVSVDVQLMYNVPMHMADVLELSCRITSISDMSYVIGRTLLRAKDRPIRIIHYPTTAEEEEVGRRWAEWQLGQPPSRLTAYLSRLSSRARGTIPSVAHEHGVNTKWDAYKRAMELGQNFAGFMTWVHKNKLRTIALTKAQGESIRKAGLAEEIGWEGLGPSYYIACPNREFSYSVWSSIHRAVTGASGASCRITWYYEDYPNAISGTDIGAAGIERQSMATASNRAGISVCNEGVANWSIWTVMQDRHRDFRLINGRSLPYRVRS